MNEEEEFMGVRNITKNVEMLMADDPNCEKSYKWLVYRYWFEICHAKPGLTFEEAKDLLDSPESINRARRKVQMNRGQRETDGM